MNFAKRFFIAWILLLILVLIMDDHNGNAGDILFGTGIFALMAGAALTFGTPGESEHIYHAKQRKINFISCMKCGYMGVGSGSCPRCGSTRTRKIAPNTSMVSCKKCGYLGAGSGTCPRCGSTWAEIISK